MANSVVTMSAKRDAVKFSTLVNGKRRSIFFDITMMPELFSFVVRKGNGALSTNIASVLYKGIHSQTKKYVTETAEMSLEQFTILKDKFFSDLTCDNYWKLSKTSKSNGQYGYVSMSC
jgi:hypothetical protein